MNPTPSILTASAPVEEPMRQNYFIEKFQNQKKEIKKIWNKILCGKGPVLPDYGEPSLKEKMDELKDKFKEFKSIFDQSKPYYKMIENLRKRFYRI